ncbi:MAG: DUF1800 domain-containing protein [Phycisphaerales bacterium]|nr:DUF1800 domain-containing protein [Phycisphaerales bacterium]
MAGQRRRWMVLAGVTLAGVVAPAWAGPVANPGWGPRVVAGLEPSAMEITLVLDPARAVQCLTLLAPADVGRDGVAVVTADDAGVVRVEDGGRVRVAAGARYAYAFLRPLKIGETFVRVGERRVRVRVVDQDTGVATAVRSRAFGEMPTVLGPAAGAGVWGEMAVGLGWWRAADEGERIVLRVSDGVVTREIEPEWVSERARGPFALAACRVDFGAFAPGDCTLRVIRRTGDREIAGDAVTVRVVSLGTSDVVTLECEDDHGILAINAMGPPKPPTPQKDKEASGGEFFANYSADPRLRVPIVVGEEEGAGWYQVMLTAAGDESAGAMPSVGLTINDAQRPRSASAIAMPRWHRIAIGTPMRLEPGQHALRLDFMNDFAAGRADRNLKLDRVEIARVMGAKGSQVIASTGGGATMAGMADEMSASMPGSMSGNMSGGMMSMGASGGSSGEAGWPANAGRTAMRIAFERPMDGQMVMGEMEVRGVTWWESQRAKLKEGGDPPRVSLAVNGRVVQTQLSDAPRFVLTPDGLKSGENTIQMIAQRAGVVATTTPQTVWLPDTLATSEQSGMPARESIRLTVHESAWPAAVREGLRDGQTGEQRFVAPLTQGTRLSVELPERLAGAFDVYLESTATGTRGVRVQILAEHGPLAGGEDAPIGPLAIAADGTIPNWHAPHRLTPANEQGLMLKSGAKRLHIDLTDPRGGWSAGSSGRPIGWLQGVRLVERPMGGDADGPAISMVYPSSDERMFGADAIVAEVADASAVTGVEVMIDGVPTGLVHDVSAMRGFGRVVAPVLLRDVAAGERWLALRVIDAYGHVSTTGERRVDVLANAPAEPTSYQKAVMLLGRVGYGPEPRELADVLRLGIDGYLSDRLSRAAGTGAMDAGDRAALELGEVRFANGRSQYDVSRRAIQQAISSSNPVRTRLVLWTQNHFSTWLRKTEAWRKMDEHEAFSRAGAARFADLLRLSATSPAMLRYLDQERSFTGRLNENYAREIMELHTLGVRGGYSQQDVTNLAHVLTGWTTARGALAGGSELTGDDDGLAEDFRTEPRAGSGMEEPRVVFGARFEKDAPGDRHERVLRAIEMLASHPKTAEYVCGKLAAHYTELPPDEGLVRVMIETYGSTGGDLREVVRAMAAHPAFWASAGRPRLAHPLDYALRLSRTTGANAPWDVGDFLAASGHGMFDRPTPDGYPELDAEVMDSNAMLQRWKLAGKADGVIADAVPPGLRWNDGPLEQPVGMDAPEESSAEPVANGDAQRIVDLIAVRLTGMPLSPASNEVAMRVLMRTAPALPARPEHWQRDARIKTVGAFIAQLPEANLR